MQSEILVIALQLDFGQKSIYISAKKWLHLFVLFPYAYLHFYRESLVYEFSVFRGKVELTPHKTYIFLYEFSVFREKVEITPDKTYVFPYEFSANKESRRKFGCLEFMIYENCENLD